MTLAKYTLHVSRYVQQARFPTGSDKKVTHCSKLNCYLAGRRWSLGGVGCLNLGRCKEMGDMH
jgi:NADH:ubiquinone oxidoreductase subunit E